MMDRIRAVDQESLRNVRRVGIAVGSVGSDQRHIGILYRINDTENVSFLHLAWHRNLQNDNDKVDTRFIWIDPAVPTARLRQVAAICRQIWRSNQKGAIPYGFSPPNDCFDRNTCEYLIGPTRYGLTCVSFVLAVFERSGLRLVNYETWPTGRPGDAEWQEQIIQKLESRADPDHIRALRNDIGTVRFRPEEVAGAAMASPLPVDFDRASEGARLVLARLAPGSAR